jgi:hypothetical protein
MKFLSVPGLFLVATMSVAELSLGGETTMYVAAHLDIADIFACVAPRPLVLEIGQRERAPGGFPADIAQKAAAEIAEAYRVFGAEEHAQLVIHPAGHVFDGTRFGEVARAVLDPAALPAKVNEAELAVTQPSKPQSTNLVFLETTTRTLLEGSQVRTANDLVIYTPDGKGNYRALWTRDFAYMVENAGDLIPQSHIETCLRLLIKGVRADGAAPDRVRPDGVPVYTAGGEDHPLGEPNIDNAQFLVLAVDAFLKRAPSTARFKLFREWSDSLDRAMDYIPRDESGLVFNDPKKPHSPYGFTDTVGKTGKLFFESLLYWTASQRLAYWHDRYGGAQKALEYHRRAGLIVTNSTQLWDSTTNAFLAATIDCRQIDIWGNAYAIWLDFPLGDNRASVLEFLARNRERFVWRGQVRHLLSGEHWQRLLVPVEPERYQNGAYWATASGWMMWALAQKDPALAAAMWQELIADFREFGVFECVNHGYRQLNSYVVSAANPLAAAQRLGF